MGRPESPWRHFLPAILWMGVLFFFSQQSHLETGLTWDFWFKKGAHVFSWGVLAALFLRAQGQGRFAWARRHAEKAWSLSVLYGVFDEVHQAFVPLRNASPRDVCIDSLGALAGLASVRFILKRWAKLSEGPRLRNSHPLQRHPEATPSKPVLPKSRRQPKPPAQPTRAATRRPALK